MKKNEKGTNLVLKSVAKVANKLGNESINAMCSWWYCQPKVPESMKKDKK